MGTFLGLANFGVHLFVICILGAFKWYNFWGLIQKKVVGGGGGIYLSSGFRPRVPESSKLKNFGEKREFWGFYRFLGIFTDFWVNWVSLEVIY